MAGFQDIFEIQQSMTVNNRRTVGQQVSRSGQVRVAQYLTSVPWVFTITPHNYLYYPQVRNIIQTIDNYDRQLPATITFNSSNLSWFTAYQGELTYGQVSSLTIYSNPVANSQEISIGGLPSGSSSIIIFKAGDFIQLDNYTYKITTNITRGIGSYVTLPLNRPIIGTVTTSSYLAFGNSCTFTVLAEQCPTYTLNPMTNGAFVQWDGPFVFREDIIG